MNDISNLNWMLIKYSLKIFMLFQRFVTHLLLLFITLNVATLLANATSTQNYTENRVTIK